MFVDTLLFTHDVAEAIYTGANNLKNDLNNSVIGSVAKTIFSLYLIKNNAYLGMIGLTIGLGFPDFSSEKTNFIWAAIFNPNVKKSENYTTRNERIRTAWINVENFWTRLKPIACTGIFGFFALPVVTVHIFTFMTAMYIGSVHGKNANKTGDL